MYAELRNFLVMAKKNTYAKNGEGKETALQDGSKEFIFKKGLWKYRDRYFGFNPFIGQEVVWYKDRPFWTMNYFGEVVSKKANPKTVYNFLKICLTQVNKSMPYRGPHNSARENFIYQNKVIGSLKKFSGKEIIKLKRSKVYNLKYQGGTL